MFPLTLSLTYNKTLALGELGRKFCFAACRVKRQLAPFTVLWTLRLLGNECYWVMNALHKHYQPCDRILQLSHSWLFCQTYTAAVMCLVFSFLTSAAMCLTCRCKTIMHSSCCFVMVWEGSWKACIVTSDCFASCYRGRSNTKLQFSPPDSHTIFFAL